MGLAGPHDVDVSSPMLALEGAAVPLSGTDPPSPVEAVQRGCGPRCVEPAAALHERLVAPVVGGREHEVPELLRAGVVAEVGLPRLGDQGHQTGCDRRGEAGTAPAGPSGVGVAAIVEGYVACSRPADCDDVRIHPADHVGAPVGPRRVLAPGVTRATGERSHGEDAVSRARHLGGAEAVPAVPDGDGVGRVPVVHPCQPVEVERVAVGTGLVDRGVAEREGADVGLVAHGLGDTVVAFGDESPAVECVPARVVVADC